MIILLNNNGIDTCNKMPKAASVPLNTWAWDGSNCWRVGRTKSFKNIWKPARNVPKQIKTTAMLMDMRVPA